MASKLKEIAIGIDLGGTHIKYALVDNDGHILFKDEANTGADNKDAVLSNLKACVDNAINQARSLGYQANCIGLGTPGVVNVEMGMLEGCSANIDGWDNIPLKGILETHSGLPTYVDNDANLIGVGEAIYGAAKYYQHAIVVTLGTGIGGAILDNGQLYRGSSNAGAEFGTMRFINGIDGEPIMWETLASTRALVQRYQELTKNELPEYNGRVVFSHYHEGNPIAIKVIEENARLVGLGIANLINVFNPHKVVIGGGVSEAGEFYIDLIRQQAFKFAEPECAAHTHICAAELGNKAGFLGAAYQAQRLAHKD